MRIYLNGWRRLWVVVSVLGLVITLVGVGIFWPQREAGITNDLNSPTCKVWRDLPDGFFPDKSPEWEEECYSLRSFLYYQHINLRLETDYDRYLLRARTKTFLVGLATWIVTALLIYFSGWSVGWVVMGFREKPRA
jgi:hypothetical protein